jgi:hypothetical protein
MRQTLEILIAIPIICIAIYLVSYLQMKGWLHAIEKFFTEQLTKIDKNDNKEEK